MSAQHTPGPWGWECKEADWVVDTGGDNTVQPVGPKGKLPVCLVVVNASWGKDHILDANAHLIAAAPDLLDALKHLLAFVEEHTATGEVIPPHTMEHVRSRAAIAKAEGGAA